MVQEIFPYKKEIKGPWLLSKKSLEELNEVLYEIERKFSKYFDILIEKEAQLKFEEYRRWDNEIDIEKEKQKLKELYTLKESESYVLIDTKQKKRIKFENLSSLLKRIEIEELNPTQLKIYIQKGPYKFNLEVPKWIDDKLEIEIYTNKNNELYLDINYLIENWLEKYMPNKLMQIWSSWLPILSILITWSLILISPFIFKNRSDIYKEELIKESYNILKDGLNNTEVVEAIEILLKLESGYVPDSFNPKITINDTFIIILICIFIITVFLIVFKPKSIIGLGRNKMKVNFYIKFYYAYLLIFMEIIISFILSKLL